MTSGKYRVFSVPPQMSWQETGFSQSKGKSARKCVSADSPRSQLLRGDRKVTVGRLRGTKGTSSHHANKGKSRVRIEIGSVGKMKPWCGKRHLGLEHQRLCLFLVLALVNSRAPDIAI